MKGLNNKNVLITGGASGIGAATAARFLEEESNVTILDCDEKGCQRIKKELPDLKATVVADVSKFNEVLNAFDELDEHFDHLDILINNAGISIRHNFLDITPEEWQKVLNINLNGVFYVAQQSAKRMLDRGGVILNTGSTNGIVGYRYYADYNVSKAGVIELTKSMALEFAPKLRVNVVCPGYVLTPMQKAEYTPEMLQEVNRKIPLGRHATPEEVAAMFAFLASDEAAYLTGQTYIIDGGEITGGLASR
jgi:meso-butanediol dehydrogenase / (S,S)-butanediol dehydrogenase / diacetyl reductase